jgi:hypothetical protein
MSATLYALVMLQGTTLSFSPGYASPTECYSVYKGPFVSCFTYNPDGSQCWAKDNRSGPLPTLADVRHLADEIAAGDRAISMRRLPASI